MLRRPVISEAAKQLHEDCLVFDLHCDTLLNQSLLGYDVTKRHTNRLPLSPFLFHADIPRMKEGGIGAVALVAHHGLAVVVAVDREPAQWLPATSEQVVDSFGDVSSSLECGPVAGPTASGKDVPGLVVAGGHKTVGRNLGHGPILQRRA